MKSITTKPSQLIILTYLAFVAPALRFKNTYTTLRKIFTQYLATDIKPGTLRKEFFELKKNNLITTKTYYGKKVYIISPAGLLYLSPRLPTIKLDLWDGRWRIVICKIPSIQKSIKEKALNKIKN